MLESAALWIFRSPKRHRCAGACEAVEIEGSLGLQSIILSKFPKIAHTRADFAPVDNFI